MSEILRRVGASPDLSIRSSDSDGRTVYGIAVPFDRETDVRDLEGSYSEVFRRGAFARTISQRGTKVKLLRDHDRSKLLGSIPILREDPAGLYVEAHIAATDEGDTALELIRAGALDAFSIGFRTVAAGTNWSPRRDHAERVEVRLDEVSLVPFPAYDDALVGGVRAQRIMTGEEAYRWREDLRDDERFEYRGGSSMSTRHERHPMTPAEARYRVSRLITNISNLENHR